MCAIIISEALRLALVNHTALPATHVFIHVWNEPSRLYCPATQHQRTVFPVPA